MSLVKKILSSSLWLLIGNSVGKFALFLISIFAARILSQEAFGQFTIIRNTISSIEGIRSGTLGSTVIKKIAETSHNEKEKLPYLLSTIFILNIIISIVLSLFLFIFSDLIIKNFFLDNTHLLNALYIGIFILISTTFSTLILIGFEEYKKIANLSVITSIVSIPTIFLLIYFFKFYGALFGVVFYYSFDFIVKYGYYKKIQTSLLHNYIVFKKYVLEFFRLSLPLFFSMIVNLFSFWYIRILVVNNANGFKEIAIFDAAYQWLTIIMLITGATTNVALSMLSKKNEEHKKIFSLNLLINFLIAFFISLIFIVFAEQIMTIYGNNYKEGKYVLIILSLTSIFFTLSAIYNRYYVANNKPINILISVLISSLCMFTFFNYQFFSNLVENLAYSFLTFYIVNFLIYFVIKFFHREIK
jgi:O-antigen/teichoic acid export membrane protein